LKSNEYIPHFGDEVYIPKFSKEVCTTSFIFWWWSVYQNLAMEYISFLHVCTTSVLGHILLLLQWSIYCLRNGVCTIFCTMYTPHFPVKSILHYLTSIPHFVQQGIYQIHRGICSLKTRNIRSL
jgi:hypothetical protein